MQGKNGIGNVIQSIWFFDQAMIYTTVTNVTTKVGTIAYSAQAWCGGSLMGQANLVRTLAVSNWNKYCFSSMWRLGPQAFSTEKK
ncbi:hypothetical protein [Noviherbaspirillum sp. ST9]|uniref:hypothetical protein n=1 Tax=Noviherbaspirillum sp. ST9 TaxID=3401606 RepID=UPI003B587894